MTTREKAAGRNAASVTGFLGRMDRMLRDSSRDEPLMGLADARGRVNSNLLQLGGRLASVRTFVSTLEKRKAGGELDGKIADAEMLPAKTAIALAACLEGAVKDADDERQFAPYPLHKLNIAIGTLAGLITADMVTQTKYPADESLRSNMMKSRESQAKRIHLDVVQAIEDVAAELGISLPEPPALSIPERTTRA